MKNNRVFNFIPREIEPHEYLIGVTKEKDIIIAYCLMLKIAKISQIILAKSSSNLNEEVENLAKYFNASVLTETT